MASTCIHGFAPGTCLICQTLDGTKATGATGATGARAEAPRRGGRASALEPSGPTTRRSAKAARAERGARGAAVEPTSPRVLPSDGHGPRSAAGLKLIGLVIGAAIVLALAWTAFHLVFAVLHIVELVAVAVVTGYVAWKAGVHHGRRTAPPKTR